MKAFVLCIVLIFPKWSFSQQLADATYHRQLQNPAYLAGMGSVVFIDEGHHNFHTKTGRYQPFSNLLERDGYNVVAYGGEFKQDELNKGKILVISNALNEINVAQWRLPTPSAFTESEIETVKKWVYAGGSLFLIADHMPMAGAAEHLAAAFGFIFTNGFVFDSLRNGKIFFDSKKGTLIENTITKGRNSTETVQQIVSFTGQGFSIPDDAISILKFDQNYKCLIPETAWVFDDKTKILDMKDWSQAAYKKFGKGRIVVTGEAAMFTAQVVGPQNLKIGMNDEDAKENFQLLLNIVHWLDGKL